MGKELAAFIAARLDEDEEWARGVIAAEARDAEDLKITVRRWLPAGFGKLHNDPWLLPSDPKRTLREVEAKRQMLDHSEDATGYDMQVEGEFGVGTRNTAEDPYVGELMLRTLAAVYSDHPDFREEWSMVIGGDDTETRPC